MNGTEFPFNPFSFGEKKGGERLWEEGLNP